jgi:hypothetical protein
MKWSKINIEIIKEHLSTKLYDNLYSIDKLHFDYYVKKIFSKLNNKFFPIGGLYYNISTQELYFYGNI